MYLPVLFLASVFVQSITAAGPLRVRQAGPGNSTLDDLIAECAPYPFLIQQFTTFSGSETSPPQISFFLANENGVDADGTYGSGPGAPFYCSVTLPMYSKVQSDFAVWSCENGTGFRFDTNSVLWVSQSMICDALWAGAPVYALANGTINTTFLSGVDGGTYNTSTESKVALDVVDIFEGIPISVADLPTCGQVCVSAEFSLGASFGCSPRNYTCLCGSSPFNTAFRDCLLGGCYSLAELQESKDFWDEFCVGEGAQIANPAPVLPASQG